MIRALAGSSRAPAPAVVMPGAAAAIDGLIAELAGSQHGVVAVRQLREIGVQRAAVSRRAAAGRLYRVHRGVYAVGHTGLSQEGRWMAAVLRAGPGAVLSHGSAALHWGVWKGRERLIDVVYQRRISGVAGVRIRGSGTLVAADVTERHGIPVTSPARTVLDLGDWMTAEQVARVVHEFDFYGLLDRSEIGRVIEANPSRHARTVLRDAVTLLDLGSRGQRSLLEGRYLEALRAAGLPEPRINTPLAFGPRTHELDIHWPEHRLLLEVDGGGHRRAHTRRQDARKDADLAAAGWTVIRGTGRGIASDVQRVRAVLESVSV